MSSSLLLRLSLLLAVFCLSVTARPGRPFHPCNTLILFSTTTTFNHHHQLIHPNFSGPRSITIFFTRSFDPTPRTRPEYRHPDNTLFGDSFYDRTKDILKVVGSLLFGVLCGAVTASAMYLLWSSLFSASRFDDLDDDVSDYEDDVSAAKKAGVYVAIPPAKEVA